MIYLIIILLALWAACTFMAAHNNRDRYRDQ